MDSLHDALEDMGYLISGDAMRVVAAIPILEARATDLAILDIHLKNGKSGIWLGEQICECYNIPFIYLTAYGDKATIAAAAKTKPASYLVKPFSPADQFIQTHRSYLVNQQKVASIGGNFVQVGEHEVPLSRNERAGVISRLFMFN